MEEPPGFKAILGYTWNIPVIAELGRKWMGLVAISYHLLKPSLGSRGALEM